MMKLAKIEWMKFWKRKVSWILLALIPLLVFVSAKYILQQNQLFSPDTPQYAVVGNFPVLGLAEMLMTAFNLFIIVIALLMVTEEYRTGALRMVFIRSHSFRKIMFAKFLVLLILLLLYLAIYFLTCYGIGYFLFSNPEVYPQFYHQRPFTFIEGFFYNLKFYGVAFLTLVAISSVIFFIGILSHTMTSAFGISVGYLLLCFAYPNFIQLFQPILREETIFKIYFTSIPMIQWEGITLLLAETPHYKGWIVLILMSHILLFQLLILFVTRKKDIFI